MLRDRLVGIRNTNLSERMQTDSALTLEKAKTMIRQKAAVKEQRRELEATVASSTFEGIATGTYRRRTNAHEQKPGGSTRKPLNFKGDAKTDQAPNQCTRCGYDKHKAGQKCPARTATCNKCNSTACDKRTVTWCQEWDGDHTATAPRVLRLQTAR